MSIDEGDVQGEWIPPTHRGGMDTMPVKYINSNRMTSATVMTTLNTAAFVKGTRPPIFKESTSAIATLPQRKDNSSLRAEQSPGRGGKTKFEQLRGLDAHNQRCQSLLSERDDFFLSLYAEKKANEDMKDYCATLIQAVYRGYSKRPRRSYSWSAPRSPGLKFRAWRFAPNEIADELCTLATQVKLQPIHGMSLIPRNKANKRERDIKISARRILVFFFRMIVARGKAAMYVARVRRDKMNNMARRIVRFFRMVFAKAFTFKVMQNKKARCATKINNAARRYLAFHRVRLLKRTARATNRHHNSAIFITRNFRAMHKRCLSKTVERRESLSLQTVELSFDGVFDLVLYDELDACVREQSLEETADEAVEVVFYGLVEAMLQGGAQTVGEQQLQEQMRELALLQKQIEEERLRLEAEQRRLVEEERLAKEAEIKREAARKARAEHDAENERLQIERAELRFSGEPLSLEGDADYEVNIDSMSPLRSMTKAMAAMPVSMTKLRGSIVDYDTKSLFTPAVVTALGDTFDKSGISLDSCESRLDRAKASFDGGDYVNACVAYSAVLEVLLSRGGKGDTARLDAVDVDSSADVFEALVDLDCLGSPKAQPALMLLSQVALFVGDCLFELCKFEGARIKYMLSRLLRVHNFGDDSAWVAEVDVRQGHVYTAKAQFLAADDAYRRALTALIPLEVSLQNILMPALTPMSRSAVASVDFGDANDEKKYDSSSEGSLDTAARNLDVVQHALVYAYSGQARLFRYWGRYGLSLQSCQHAFSACESLFSNRGERNELLLAEVLSTRASLCKMAGLPDRAYELLEEVREIYTEILGTQHPLTASSGVRLAYVAAFLGKFHEALDLVDTAILVQRGGAETDVVPSGGTDGKQSALFFGEARTLSVAQSLHCKGWVYLRLARYGQSRPLLEASYQLRSDILADDTHPCVASGISSMADLAAASGEYQEALQNYEVALDNMKSSLTLLPHFRLDDADDSSSSAAAVHIHVITANTMYNKAQCLSLYGCGAAAEALTLFEEVKAAKQQYHKLRKRLLEGSLTLFVDLDKVDDEVGNVQDRTSLSVVAVDLAIARQLLYLGQIPIASAMAKEAHTTIVELLAFADVKKQKSINPSDPVLADALLLLGEIASMRGHWSEADEFLDQSCAIKESILGSGHPDVAHVVLLMANNLLGPGYVQEAKHYCERAAEVLAVQFDKKSAPMASCLFTTAQVIRDSGDLVKALQLYTHALYVTSLFYTEKSVLYGMVLEGLGECQRRQKNTEHASQSFKSAVAVLSTCYGNDHLYTLGPVRGLAQVLIDLRNDREALALLVEHVIPGVTHALGETSPLYVYCRGLVGQCNRIACAKYVAEGGDGDDADNTKEEEEAQVLIDDALVFFDTFEYGSYNEQHVWVLAMGGFLGSSRVGTARTSRVGTAQAVVSAANTFRSDSSARRKEHIDDGNGILPSHVPVVNVLTSLLLTEREKTLPLLTGSRPVTAQCTTGLLLTEDEIVASRPTTRALVSRLDLPEEDTLAVIELPGVLHVDKEAPVRTGVDNPEEQSLEA